MKCPVCTTVNLALTDRQGVEIDYCPQCRGVWLDRGELDKLIERAQTSPPMASSHRQQPHRDDQDRFSYGRDGREHNPDYRARKKKSFLGEIFDFD